MTKHRPDNKVYLINTLLLLASIALSSSAQAQDRQSTQAILASGKIGGLFPVSQLGPHVDIHLGTGYLMPVWGGRLAAIIDLGYSRTSTDKILSDVRLGQEPADTNYEYTLRQHDLELFLGPQYYILDPWRKLVPYVAIGLDLHFLKSVIEGSGGGNNFGENNETSTQAGFAFRGGAGYRLGPGLITAELSVGWAPIDHQITGDSHLSRIALLVGYTALIGW